MGNAGSSYSSSSRSHHRPPPQPRLPVRRVPLKVLCLGLPRTGTASLREALRHLGYGDVYHFSTVYNEQPADATLWNRALTQKYVDKSDVNPDEWNSAIGNCAALTDIPCVIFWRDLLKKNPNTLIILTVRDSPEEWLESYNKTVKPWFSKLYADVKPDGFGAKLRRAFRHTTNMEKMAANIQKHYLSGIDQEGADFYVKHNEEVIGTAKYGTYTPILVYNVKEGWGPLCDFLDRPVPVKKPFPHLNERGTFPSMFTEKSAENTQTRAEIKRKGESLE